MWKIVVGFIVFAAVAMFVLMRAGDKVDMGGEKHDTGSHTAAPAAAPAPAATPAPAAPATVASGAVTAPAAPAASVAK
jgi:hypothetical protein